MPLPCSPVSMSTGEDTSTSQSQSAHTSDSEGSLITPRPGPSAPEQRTQATLSRPARLDPEAFKRSSSFKDWRTDPTRERASASSEDDEVEQALESGHGIRPPAPDATAQPKHSSLPPSPIDDPASKSALSTVVTVASIEPVRPVKKSPAPSIRSVKSTRSARSRSNSSSSTKAKSQVKAKPNSGLLSTSPKFNRRPGEPSRAGGVTFHSSTRPGQGDEPVASPGTSFSAYLMARKASPRGSLYDAPHLHEEPESSADENTAILRRQSNKNGPGPSSYRTTARLDLDDAASPHAAGYEAVPDPSGPPRRRSFSQTAHDVALPVPSQSSNHGNKGTEAKNTPDTWWRAVAEKYGSVELENKGSVARDHLALERTFLAWLRTSLSFASIGIAVTQLFRLNTTLQESNGGGRRRGVVVSGGGGGGGGGRGHGVYESAFLTALASSPDFERLSRVGKPLGATFLAVAILVLFVGFHRYFESQHYVIRGKFPASRGSVLLISFVAGGLIVSSLVVILSIVPTAARGG